MSRGNIAQAPISQPASPTRVNKNAVLVTGVAIRMSEAIAMIAPAPMQTPSSAAMTGWGQPRIAFTRSPVIRVKRSNSGIAISVSGPMIS